MDRINEQIAAETNLTTAEVDGIAAFLTANPVVTVEVEGGTVEVRNLFPQARREVRVEQDPAAFGFRL